MPYFPSTTLGVTAVTAVSGTDEGLPVRPIDQATSSSHSTVLVTPTLTTLLTDNPSRVGALFYADMPGLNKLFLQFGDLPSGSYTVKMDAQSLFELPRPVYTGVIRGRWLSAGTGSLQITELM